MSYENNQVDLEEEVEKPSTAKAVLITLLVIAGMGGLFFHVEYTGWVLFVGLIGAMDFI